MKQGTKKKSGESEKTNSFRPLKVIIAIIVVVVAVIILDRLPTKRTYTKPTPVSMESELKTEESDGSRKGYYYLSGLLERFEESLEARLNALGVPEEEYENIGDYLSKDEIFEAEAKATLAAELEEVWVYASPEDLYSLKDIFNLEDSYTFSRLDSKTPPTEYKILKDLLGKYNTNLTNVEDYDIIEKV